MVGAKGLVEDTEHTRNVTLGLVEARNPDSRSKPLRRTFATITRSRPSIGAVWPRAIASRRYGSASRGRPWSERNIARLFAAQIHWTDERPAACSRVASAFRISRS